MREVAKGATNITDYVYLADISTGQALTGKIISDIDIQYVRSGATVSALGALTALAATNTAHTDQRGIEIDGTEQPGLYRIDWPDAMFVTGVNNVIGTVHIPGVSAPAHREFKLHDRPAVGVAFDNIVMAMVLSSDHASPAEGVTATLTVSKNGIDFVAKDAASSVAEIGTNTGDFQIDLGGADVTKRTWLKLTAATADDSKLFFTAEGE